MALSLGPLYESIVLKVKNGCKHISIKTTAHWNIFSMAFGGLVLVNSLAKGFQGEIGFLEKHTYKHNIFPQLLTAV